MLLWGLKNANNFTPANGLLAAFLSWFSRASPLRIFFRPPTPSVGGGSSAELERIPGTQLLKPWCRTLTDACARERFAVYK